MHESFQNIQDFFKSPKQILITTHTNPDGDAIGSTVGLACALRQQGHTVSIVLPNAAPSFLKTFLEEENWFIAEGNEARLREEIQHCDLIATLDYNHPSRAGEIIENALSQIVSPCFVWMVDHHIDPSNYAKWTFSDTKKSSTCEMIWDILKELNWVSFLSPLAANALYTGIMTDTGSFRFPSTSSATHRAVAGLIDSGAEPSKVHEGIFDQNRLERLRLLSSSLANLKVLKSGNAVAFYLSAEEQKKIGLEKGDTEGFVNYGLSVEGISLSAFFVESDHFWKLSLRSKGDVDVNQMSRALFNGGGHKNAAGGKYIGSIESAIEAIEKYLDENI